MPTTMTRKAQVTIPKSVRDRVGIQPGDKVVVRAGAAGAIVVEKADRHDLEGSHNRSWLDEALAEIRERQGERKPPFTTDEIMRMTRGED